MSCNNYKPHLHIYSEDAATHDMVIGFIEACECPQPRQILLRPYSSGWSSAVEEMKINGRLGKYPERRILCVIDLDNRDGARIEKIRRELASVYEKSEVDRIYILGCAAEVESAKKELNFIGHNDAFGHKLADLSSPMWTGDAVKDAKGEIERLMEDFCKLAG